METGQKFGEDGDQATVTAMQAIQDEAQARRTSDKAAKKSVFDSEYDMGEQSTVPSFEKEHVIFSKCRAQDAYSLVLFMQATPDALPHG